MATASQKTTSMHTTAFVQATHRFDILGYSRLKSLGVRTSVRSGSFNAGGFPWALVCCFDEIVEPAERGLASISLELSKNETNNDVVAMASLRIDEAAGTGQFPAAVWQSDKAKNFGPWHKNAVAWVLAVPAAFRENEARYIDAAADCLTIHCTVDVLQQDSAAAGAASDCFVSVPPPPSIARDFHRLLRGNSQPDVTFVVEDDTEIHAHKLVLAARSSVFRAEFFHGDMKERSTQRLKIDGMSAATMWSMLYFIYTDEQPTPLRGEGSVAAAQDLLVVADLYDLERLRLMCEKTLYENMDADNVMETMMQAHGRHSYRQLEASCIEFMLASNSDVYEAIEDTLQYKELEKDCGPFINELTKKVARRALARNSPLSSSSTFSNSSLPQPHRSKSTYNPYTVFRGTHEFRIGNLNAARQKRHGVDEYIRSGTFLVGGYGWAIDVYPWKKDGDDKEHAGIFLVLLNAPADVVINVKASGFFRIHDPNGKSPAFSRELGPMHIYTKVGQSYGFRLFITLESATSTYLGHDGSLTVHGEFQVATVSRTSTANTNVGAKIIVPPTDLSWHFEQLLVSEQGSDVKFMVEQSEIRAHRLVISARLPVLHKMVELATNADHVRIDDIGTIAFKAILHFIYTDELPLKENLVLQAIDFTTVAGDMLAAACRFRLERMKQLCMNLLAEKVTTVSEALATVKVARRHGCPELEQYCRRYMSLPHVSKEVTEACISLFLQSQLA